MGNTTTDNFHTKQQDCSPDPKQATINLKKISLFGSIAHFSIFWAEDSFLPLGCLKQWDSLQSGTEITVWVSLWAAVPWHGKLVCSTYLIAQATRNAFSAGVRKTEMATSGLVEARGKTSLPTHFYGMVQSVALHWLEGHIYRQVSNKLWSKKALLSSAVSF